MTPNFVWTSQGFINLQFVSLVEEEFSNKGEHILLVHRYEQPSLILRGQDTEVFLKILYSQCLSPNEKEVESNS